MFAFIQAITEFIIETVSSVQHVSKLFVDRLKCDLPRRTYRDVDMSRVIDREKCRESSKIRVANEEL